jgi:hypothetical protein
MPAVQLTWCGSGALGRGGAATLQFQEVYKLRPRLHAMHVALQTYGGTNGVKKDDFRRAAKKIGGANLTDTQVR